MRLFNFIGNYVAFPIKQKALRVDRTAAEKNLSLRDPPQAENPALQDSILIIGIFCIWQMDTHLMMQGLWQNKSYMLHVEVILARIQL